MSPTESLELTQFIPEKQLRFVAENLHRKRVFITGGTGFFGKSTLEVLDRLNVEFGVELSLSVLSRNPEAFKETLNGFSNLKSVKIVQGDVTQFKIQSEAYDFILHYASPVPHTTAAATSADMLNSVMAGSKNILDFAAKCGVKKFLLASSGAVYEEQTSDSKLTEDKVGKINLTAYGEGKRRSEILGAELGAQYGFDHTSARCFALVGPYLNPNAGYAAGNFIRDAVTGKEIVILGDGTSMRSYLYSRDLVVWLLTIMLKGKNGNAFNLGSDRGISVSQLAEKVKELVNPNVQVTKKNQKDGKTSFYVPSIEKARKELELDVWTPFDRAILNTATHYRGLLCK